jgi:hypothetical protein
LSKKLICPVALAIALIAFLLPEPCHAQTVLQPTQKQDQAIRKFLLAYAGSPSLSEEKGQPTRYFAAIVGLSGDKAGDVIVYITGGGACGTGGCTTLVLAPNGPSYRVVAQVTITHRPIRVLAATSHGWHDIAVYVSGGGISQGYEAKLSFDGKSYPTNPTIEPAEPITGSAPGRTAISEGTLGKLVYK